MLILRGVDTHALAVIVRGNGKEEELGLLPYGGLEHLRDVYEKILNGKRDNITEDDVARISRNLDLVRREIEMR